MLSDFRKRKLTRFFAVVDTNGDGVFTSADTALIGDRLCDLRGLKPGTATYTNFRNAFLYYWADVRKACSPSDNGRVTLDEWLAYHETMLADDQRFSETVQNSVAVMFALMDQDHDGTLTLDEYGEWMKAWGMVDDDSRKIVFDKLDINNDGTLTTAEMFELTREFYYSDDPESPGNWAMGAF